MGYMMGSIPFMWHTPFHPAYYYSRPSYVTNPDGTVEVYPPTFSYMTLFFTIVIIGGIVLLVVVAIRRRRMYSESNSSFSWANSTQYKGRDPTMVHALFCAIVSDKQSQKLLFCPTKSNFFFERLF